MASPVAYLIARRLIPANSNSVEIFIADANCSKQNNHTHVPNSQSQCFTSGTMRRDPRRRKISNSHLTKH
jgi:hypothetical protein